MKRRYLKPFIAVLCVALAFVLGVVVGDLGAGSDESRTRAELLESIDESFYKNVDRKKLEEASFDGIVKSLGDRFSHYFTPKETQEFQRAVTDPRFEGIGVSVAQHPKGLRIVQVYDDSPAKRAGVLKGDLITGVAGKSIAGQASDVSTAKIRGKAGTDVRLTIRTPSTKKEREVTIERAQVDIPAADGELVERNGRKIGHVRLFGFSNGAHGELREEVDRLTEQGAEGFVLDLRGNGGGLLREGILVASTFIEDGPIVSTKGRARAERKYEAEGDAIGEKVPLTVLVDKGSASASEIVTGALRDRKRATVVGEKTFGKGVFQEVQELPNGGSLDLTVGQYFLPNGENIGGKGITPQVKAKDDPKTQRDEALPVAVRELIEKLPER